MATISRQPLFVRMPPGSVPSEPRDDWVMLVKTVHRLAGTREWGTVPGHRKRTGIWDVRFGTVRSGVWCCEVHNSDTMVS